MPLLRTACCRCGIVMSMDAHDVHDMPVMLVDPYKLGSRVITEETLVVCEACERVIRDEAAVVASQNSPPAVAERIGADLLRPHGELETRGQARPSPEIEPD